MKLDYIKHWDYTCEHPVCLVFDYYDIGFCCVLIKSTSQKLLCQTFITNMIKY